MKRNLFTIIIILFCFSIATGTNKKPKLITLYAEDCGYSQELIKNTLCDNKVQEAISTDFEYQLLEQATKEAQDYIEQFNITGFPTQILLADNNALFAYGVLSVEEELDFIAANQDISYINNYFNNEKSTQEGDPFELYVFRKTTLGFDQETKKVLAPTYKEPYRKCRKRKNPERYVCVGGGGKRASHNFITKGENKGDFKVAIFHPSEKIGGLPASITTFVEDGKVTTQGKCYLKTQGHGLGTDNERYYSIVRMRCYVVTAELCELINEVKGVEDAKDKDRFQRFLALLKSEQYNKSLLETYKFTYEKSFLTVNVNQNYKYHSKLDEKRYYDIARQGKMEGTRIWHFEQSELVKQSDDLYNVLATDQDGVFDRFYIKPCTQLAQGNIIAKSK